MLDVQLMHLVHFRWILMHSSNQYIFLSVKPDQLEKQENHNFDNCTAIYVIFSGREKFFPQFSEKDNRISLFTFWFILFHHLTFPLVLCIISRVSKWQNDLCARRKGGNDMSVLFVFNIISLKWNFVQICSENSDLHILLGF